MNTHSCTNISSLPQHSSNTLGPAEYSQLTTYYEESHQLRWCYLQARERPCFNLELMDEIHAFYRQLHDSAHMQKTHPIRYQVLASNTPGIFSLGGDLEMFRDLVVSRDLQTLGCYARTCVEAMYARATIHRHGITEITLVQGDALGGGFESAIAGDVLIAERSSRFGFPDVLFNSFPGIGAHTFLSRKVGLSIAERMILSGKLYSAEELFDMGIVDVLADENQGETAVYNYIARTNRCENTSDALRKIRDMHYPISLEQLLEVAEIWANGAMRLTGRDLKMIERLIAKQKSFSNHAA